MGRRRFPEKRCSWGSFAVHLQACAGTLAQRHTTPLRPARWLEDYGGRRVTDGGWRKTDGGWRVSDGGWRVAIADPGGGSYCEKSNDTARSLHTTPGGAYALRTPPRWCGHPVYVTSRTTLAVATAYSIRADH